MTMKKMTMKAAAETIEELMAKIECLEAGRERLTAQIQSVDDRRAKAEADLEAAKPSEASIEFVYRDGAPERLVCEVELSFGSTGPLRGMKLIGFNIWRSPDGEIYVTFPCRAFGLGAERRFFDYLRSVDGVPADVKRVKGWIIAAFQKREAQRQGPVQPWKQSARGGPLMGASTAELLAAVLEQATLPADLAGTSLFDLAGEDADGLVALGLKPRQARRLVAALDLAKRVAAEPSRGCAFRSAEEAGRYLMPRYSTEPVEVFGILALDVRHRLRREVVISRGCLTSSLVHPREVFRPAINARAASVLLFHNHPSGDPEPSAEDIAPDAPAGVRRDAARDRRPGPRRPWARAAS